MSYPRTPRARTRRQAEYRRMIEQLESGVPPHRIAGDRDVLQAAMTTVQRRCDVADDTPGGMRP